MSWLDVLATRGAARVPDRPAIIVPAGAGAAPAATLTYAALDRAVSAFAGALRARGARPGERLVLANANTPAFFVALLGAARAGLVAVPLDAGLATAELANVLGHARPHAVVVDARSAAAFAPLGVPLCTVEPDASTGSAGSAAPPAAAAEAGLLLYTSGTTGTPRGALHSHAAILHKLEAIRAWFGLGDGDRALCLLPTHFGHGLVCACLTTLHYGGTLVLCPPFDAALLPRVFALADAHRVTTFSTVPTIVRLLLRSPIASPAQGSLRFVTCASAPLHPEEVGAFEARFAVPLLNCYGLTEAGTWSAMSPVDRAVDRDRRSVGTAAGCEIRAVAVAGELRTPLPAGATGELEIRGPSVMLGYDRDPAATARAVRDGWLATGDLGWVDAHGRVFLAGRSKDLIIRAGVNIHPAEIEAVLLRHPGVADAHVFGLEHAVLGEAVAACVARKPDAAGAASASSGLAAIGGPTAPGVSAADLIQHCRAALAPHKCPEQIRFVDALPRSARGKLDRAARAALRALFTAPAAAPRPSPSPDAPAC